MTKETAPRSYDVETASGQYQRNHQHIIRLPTQLNSTPAKTNDHDTNTELQTDHDSSTDSQQDSMYTYPRSGRVSKPPTHLISSGLM